MLIVRPGSIEQNEVSDETLHFNYPGSDIILRSSDSHNFRLPSLYIVICSPILRDLIKSVSSTSDAPNGEELKQEPLPVVKLPESKATLYSLLTFIFPVTPILPLTAEDIMGLLAVAQKYQMDSVLSHIRDSISRHDPPLIRPETALHVYFLAQQHELHQEAVQAARVTLRSPMTIDNLEDKLDFPGMTGAYLHELWKYHERARNDLKSSVLEFLSSGLPGVVRNLRCQGPRSCDCCPGVSIFPQWLNDYVNSIWETPHLFDLIEFEFAWARHIQSQPNSSSKCSCVSIPIQVIRTFWEALTAAVHETIEKADLTLCRVKEEPTSETSDPPSAPLCLDMPDASVILRSSDHVHFRVHKSVLAMSSPFFKDMFSLPQPPDDELVDGLPVIAVSEDASLLNSLISLLYPIPPVIPGSYEKMFALLAACQKYEMESVQSTIRAAVKVGTFPAPVKAEGFSAYAIASSMGLVLEMEDAARLTFGQPMTFESLGEGLRSFNGRALCDLIRYRKSPQ
ncbi:hypothetical protein EI94DRAFT_1815075 [Lactarius quietus]|nr:hypothetical protein EI94DRAFT_1815075 [Lactarius quietus]